MLMLSSPCIHTRLVQIIDNTYGKQFKQKQCLINPIFKRNNAFCIPRESACLSQSPLFFPSTSFLSIYLFFSLYSFLLFFFCFFFPKIHFRITADIIFLFFPFFFFFCADPFLPLLLLLLKIRSFFSSSSFPMI